jgi:hypothetical protein
MRRQGWDTPPGGGMDARDVRRLHRTAQRRDRRKAAGDEQQATRPDGGVRAER